MRDVGARIAEERRARGLTQSQLAARVGSSDKHLQRVEAGSENLTLRTLASFAGALGIDPGALFRPPLEAARRRRGRPARPKSPPSSPIARISPGNVSAALVPLLTLTARAGDPDALSDTGLADWVRLEGRRRPAGHFVARVLGTSMSPRIPDGSLVLFRARPSAPTTGAIVLVEMEASDVGGRYVLKRLRVQGETAEGLVRCKLESLDRRTPPIPVELGRGADARIVAEFVDVLPSPKAN